MNIPNSIDVNLRLTDIRKRLKKDRNEFAEILSISKSHLSNIENGNRGVTIDIIDTLFYKFNISANYLLYGEGPMFVKEQDSNQIISGMSNTEKLETLLKLYHYFSHTKDLFVDGNVQDTLEFLRQADYEIWLAYSKQIGEKIKIIDK